FLGLFFCFFWKPMPVSAAIPAAGLVGYWNFEEGGGSTAADASGNGNNGTLMNMGAPSWIGGRFGMALSFDGVDDYVKVENPANGSLDPNYVTVAAWVNPAILQSQYLVSKDRDCDTPGQGGYGLRMSYDGRIGGEIWRNSNRTILETYGSTALTPGNWYHV